MKKGLIAVAVLVAGGVAAMPYVTGKIAESETRAMLATMSEQAEQYGSANIVEYDRGYASSKVRYEYDLPAGIALIAGEQQSYMIDCDYAHGIVGIDYDCNLLANEEYKQFVDKEFGGQDPLTITGAISMGGGWSQDIALQAIDSELENGKLKLAPSNITINTDKDFSVYNGEANLGKLDFSNAEGTLNMAASNLLFNLKPTKLGLYEGEYKMKVGDLEMLNQGVKASVKGLALVAGAVERGEVMDATVDMDLASFEGNGATASNVNLRYEALGVNSQALVDYQEFATQMQADILASLEEGDTEAANANQMLALLPIVERMLDAGLKLNVKASGDIMSKPNSVDLKMNLLKKTSFTELSALAFNPESVLSHFDISLDASLNQELVQSNPQMGVMIANSPFFESADGSFKTSLKVGEASSVNGKAVSFNELMAMAMTGAQPQMQPQPLEIDPELEAEEPVFP